MVSFLLFFFLVFERVVCNVPFLFLLSSSSSLSERVRAHGGVYKLSRRTMYVICIDSQGLDLQRRMVIQIASHV